MYPSHPYVDTNFRMSEESATMLAKLKDGDNFAAEQDVSNDSPSKTNLIHHPSHSKSYASALINKLENNPYRNEQNK